MWIEALRVEGGVLDGFNQAFRPELNVLIGARGTGKSSVIELIRFCLGVARPSEQHEFTEHALAVLGDGRVILTLVHGEDRLELSRSAHDRTAERPFQAPLPIIFSQSEVESIGLHAQSRLRLIDGFLTPATSATDARGAARISSITAELRLILAEIDDISSKIAELPRLQEQLRLAQSQSAVQSQINKSIEKHRATLGQVTPGLASSRVRLEALTRAHDRTRSWMSQLEALLDAPPSLEAWPAQAGPKDGFAHLRRRLDQSIQMLRAGLSEIGSLVTELDRQCLLTQGESNALEKRAREIRQKIEEHQRGASALDKRISDLAQQVSVLSSLSDLRDDRKARASQLIEQRAALLADREVRRQARTLRREKVAKQLSKALGPSIRVTIKPFSALRSYLNVLTAALRGSGLRYSELAERVVATFSPQEIALIAEGRDIAQITSALGLTEDRAWRLCDALRGEAGAALFTTPVEDDVELKLMDGRDYKAIDFLSMGQRCTVVLPIILQHTDRPIILDQPEDHLDNAFVVGTLIKAIAARTQVAQTIIATHNPNIPVLANAAMVIQLDSDGSRCFVRAAGPVDHPSIVQAITTLMEGGREAFARRAEFYGSTFNAS